VLKGGLSSFIENDSFVHDGFSVTMPLKEEAFKFAQVTDELSNVTRASNTLVRMGDKWHGFNTDIFGIIQAVKSKIETPPTRTLVIGSGSTARSALVAISRLAPSSKVQIFARNRKTQRDLLRFAAELGLQSSKCYFLLNGLQRAQLTISTLPGGALDIVSKSLSKRLSTVPGGLLLDVAYHPWPSRFASFWMARDKPVVSGLDMLVWQAVAQIRIFMNGSTEVELPNEVAVVEAMRLAASE
jgi:shikimate dehydrogenase